MQRMGGGGNDPTCGCDMQAGWPSAATFPRGGLQGGGVKHANFSVSWENNEGKTHKYKGRINQNGSMKTRKTNRNTLRTIMSSASGEFKKVAYKGEALLVSNNTGEAYTRRKNGTMGSYRGTLVTNAAGKKTLIKSKTPKRVTAAPPNLENDYETPMTNMEEDENEYNSFTTNSQPLSQDGGGKKQKHKHKKGCKCMLCFLLTTRKRR